MVVKFNFNDGKSYYRWVGGHELLKIITFDDYFVFVFCKMIYFLSLVSILFSTQKLTNFRGNNRKKKLS